MTVYALAQLKMKDRETYNRYQHQFMPVFLQFQGRLLAADESPEVLEGRWERDKVVLMSFPDEASFREWHDSEDYQRIARDRKAGADTIVLLLQGFSPSA